MDTVKIISTALCSLIIIMLLRRVNSDYASAVSGIIGISICFFSLGILIPVFDFIRGFGNDTSAGELYLLIFKSAGISLLCSFAAELCRDCGEAGLGTKIELAGKCTLISLCLPLIQRIFENAEKFMD